MNQAKYSPMHEHAMDDAKCMSSCPMSKGNTNAQEYMHAMSQNPHPDTHKAAKIDSNQRIQENKFKT